MVVGLTSVSLKPWKGGSSSSSSDDDDSLSDAPISEDPELKGCGAPARGGLGGGGDCRPTSLTRLRPGSVEFSTVVLRGCVIFDFCDVAMF